MSQLTKRKFLTTGKILSFGFFALLFFLNLKIGLVDGEKSASADVSLAGVELTLFEGTYASDPGNCIWSCYWVGGCPGEENCNMYEIGSINCGVMPFIVFVGGYSGDYCDLW